MKNKVVVVVGATSMIGRAVAKLFSVQEAALVLIGRSLEKLQPLVNGLKYNADVFATDLQDSQALIKIMDQIIKKSGRVDCLIQNTAIYPIKPVEALSLEEWNQSLQVNLTAYFIAVNTLVPLMKKQQAGKIILMSSLAGEWLGVPGMSAYSATKAGINGLMRSLAIELAPFNINVNSISPGKMYDDIDLTEQEKMNLLKPVPLKRFIKPEEVAQLALFLCSEHAENITGQNLVMDGGQTILAQESHLS